MSNHLPGSYPTYHGPDTDSGDVLMLEVAAFHAITGTKNFIQFVANNTVHGRIEFDIQSGIGDPPDGVSYETSGADFCEQLPRLDPDEEIASGEVVGIFGGKISKRTSHADWVMATSSHPAFVGNSGLVDDPSRLEVAFVGQTFVRVFGPVEPNDYLVASGDHDGAAVAVPPDTLRPDQVDAVIGRAWQRSPGGESYVRTIVGLPGSNGTSGVVLREKERVADGLSSAITELKDYQDTLERRLARLESILNNL